MVKQMELIPVPRPRVRLGGPDSETRPRTQLAEALTRARVRLEESSGRGEATSLTDALLMPEPELELIPDPSPDRSAWSRNGNTPPLTGWWEVTDHKTGTLLARWWYDGDWSKGDPKDKMSTRLSHAQFVTQYAWRGLRMPHPDVYPCPPYVSTGLVTRAREARVSILTTYIRFKAAPIGPGVTETTNAPQWPNGRPRVKL